MNDNIRYWVATAPVGAASVLAEELAQFGAESIRERSHLASEPVSTCNAARGIYENRFFHRACYRAWEQDSEGRPLK